MAMAIVLALNVSASACDKCTATTVKRTFLVPLPAIKWHTILVEENTYNGGYGNLTDTSPSYFRETHKVRTGLFGSREVHKLIIK